MAWKIGRSSLVRAIVVACIVAILSAVGINLVEPKWVAVGPEESCAFQQLLRETVSGKPAFFQLKCGDRIVPVRLDQLSLPAGVSAEDVTRDMLILQIPRQMANRLGYRFGPRKVFYEVSKKT